MPNNSLRFLVSCFKNKTSFLSRRIPQEVLTILAACQEHRPVEICIRSRWHICMDGEKVIFKMCTYLYVSISAADNIRIFNYSNTSHSSSYYSNIRIVIFKYSNSSIHPLLLALNLIFLKKTAFLNSPVELLTAIEESIAANLFLVEL